MKFIAVLKALGNVVVKNSLIASTDLVVAFFISSHNPIQKFLKPSLVFHKYTNPATNAEIPALTKVTGPPIAAIAAFNKAKAPLKDLTILAAVNNVFPTLSTLVTIAYPFIIPM